MDKNDLKKFLIESCTKGYSAGDSVIQKHDDFSYSTTYESGKFILHDNWFGGEPFGGREVVFCDKKPYWMMVYYGSDSGKAEGLIAFLRRALAKPDSEIPVRGPKELTDGDFRYVNTTSGTLEDFVGEEKIYFKGKEAYKAYFSGGLVDKREDQ